MAHPAIGPPEIRTIALVLGSGDAKGDPCLLVAIEKRIRISNQAMDSVVVQNGHELEKKSEEAEPVCLYVYKDPIEFDSRSSIWATLDQCLSGL